MKPDDNWRGFWIGMFIAFLFLVAYFLVHL